MPRSSARCSGVTVEAATRSPTPTLAALALEHGIGVCSADTDFARFDGLRWHNPLAV